MSRRTDPSPKHTGSESRTKARHGPTERTDRYHGPSWPATIAVAIAAMILTLASLGPIYSLSQLTLNPRGMPAAMQETEYLALNRKPANALPGKPTFDSILKQYADRRNKRESARQYYAVKQLLSSVATAENSNQAPNQQTLDRGAAAVGNDEKNVISRTLYALLVDIGRRHAEADAADRFAALDSVLSAPPTPTTNSTYDAEFRRLLEDSFAATAPRPDVTASMAAKWYESYIVGENDWFTTLSAVARSLDSLSQALSAEGRNEDAAKCKRWLAQFCIGLVESADDTAIQCLAAGTLAATESDNPAIARPMRGLVDAHTGDAGHAADWAAQFKSNGAQPLPSLAPTEYERAFERLILYLLLAVLALSAGVAFVIGVASIVAPSDPADARPAQKPPLWQSLLLFFGLVVLIPLFLAMLNANILHDGQAFYAESLAFFVVQMTFVAGFGPILVHAVFTAWPKRDHAFIRRRIGPAFVLGIVAYFTLAMSAILPGMTATLLRRLNYFFPQLWWSVVAMLLFVIVAVLVARVPARQLARSAAAAWLVFALLACVAMKLHVNADHEYQRAVVAAHRDPMAARAGEDWKKKYVKPVKNAFTPPIP